MEQNIEETQPTLMNHAVKWGVIVGVINIILLLLIYVIDITLLANWWVGILFLIINLIVVIYAGINFRNTGDGYLRFGKAFTYSFVLLIVAGLIGLVFRIILFLVIDPDAVSVIADATVDKTEQMLSNFGMDDSQIDEAVEKARENVVKQYTVSGMLIGYLISIIFAAIGALIVGAIIKKKNPEEEI